MSDYIGLQVALVYKSRYKDHVQCCPELSAFLLLISTENVTDINYLYFLVGNPVVSVSGENSVDVQ